MANVASLTCDQLFQEIKLGNVTLDELIKNSNGMLSKEKRECLKNLQVELDLKDEKAWESACYGNEADLRDYINAFPTGKHVQDAKAKIIFLETERKKAEDAKEGILDDIKRNSNIYDPDVIKRYLENSTITNNELLECGIPQDVINTIYDINPPRLQLGNPPTSIPEGYTEVYFWGIPGSGKTCSLAALLSTAHRKGYLNIAIGPGYDYMTRLKNIFIEDNAILPPPSPVDTTQYLPFTLKKVNEKHARSVSLIELSGEIFQCFFFENASMEMPSQSHKETFNSLNKFLKGKNRKIHFFFIDYDKDNEKDTYGYTQSDYLEAASTYFNKTENRVFGKSTDAIYVVITKSDLMDCPMEHRVTKAKDYLNSESFLSFINTLKDNCKKYSINAGKLTVEPFSLGKVYFQQICDFDDSTAHNIIKILMKRIPASRKSILDIFNK